jgi:hypothetical protein
MLVSMSCIFYVSLNPVQAGGRQTSLNIGKRWHWPCVYTPGSWHFSDIYSLGFFLQKLIPTPCCSLIFEYGTLCFT